MKFLPFHKNNVPLFKVIEYCSVLKGWRTIDIDASVYCLYERHGALSFTKSDLLFANLNLVAILDEASQVDRLYVKDQVAAIARFGDSALQRIATNIVDHTQLLNIEPHGMTLPLRRSLLAFTTVFNSIEIK